MVVCPNFNLFYLQNQSQNTFIIPEVNFVRNRAPFNPKTAQSANNNRSMQNKKKEKKGKGYVHCYKPQIKQCEK